LYGDAPSVLGSATAVEFWASDDGRSGTEGAAVVEDRVGTLVMGAADV